MRFGASPVAITAMVAVYGAAGLVGAPLLGRISDFVGRKPVILLCLCGMALANFVMFYAGSLVVVFFARALAGAMSSNITILEALVADNTTPEARTSGMAMLGFAGAAGLVLGPLAGGLLAGSGAESSARLTFAVAGATCLVAVVALLVVWNMTTDRTSRDRRPPGKWRQIVHAVMANRTLLGLNLCAFVVQYVVLTTMSVTALWTHYRFGFGPREVGVIVAMCATGMIAAQVLLMMGLLRSVPAAVTLPAAFMMSAAALLFLVLAPRSALVFPGFFLLYCGLGTAIPVVTSAVSSAAPDDEQGTILGVMNAVKGGAEIAAPIAAGIVFTAFSISAPFLLAAALLVGGTLLFALSTRRK